MRNSLFPEDFSHFNVRMYCTVFHFMFQVGKLEISLLEKVLLQTNSLPHLWVIPALTTAWTTLLHYPFVKG